MDDTSKCGGKQGASNLLRYLGGKHFLLKNVITFDYDSNTIIFAAERRL